MNSTLLSNKNKQATKQLHIFEMAFILFCSVYYILPIITNAFPETLFTLLALCYVGYVFLIQPTQNGYLVSFLALAVWISTMYFLLTTSFTVDASVENFALKLFMSKFFQYFLMFFPTVLAIRVITQASQNQIKLLLGIISMFIVFVVIVTLRELEIHPNITRSWDSDIKATYSNVASYYFIYAVPILISILIIAMLKYKNTLFKIAGIIVVVFLFFFLLQAQYTLSVLIAMISVVMAFLKSSQSTHVKVISTVLIFLTLFFFVDIFEFLAAHVESSQISLRLTELANFFSTGDASGYNLNSRMTLYWETIKAFFQSPLYGHSYLDFDGHATFLTVLADTGILGGIPFYVLYFTAYKKILGLINDNEKLLSIPFIALALTGLTNPIHASYPVGFAIWFICPMIIILLQNTLPREVKTHEKLEN